MKIAIIGTGGVGGFFGAKLAKAGNDVTFLARGAHLEALNKNGLTVKSVDGDFKVDNIKATDEISNIQKVDLIILGVKAWHVKEIAKELHNVIKDNTVVLPLQNGVLAVEELQEHINEKHIIGGLCRIISKIESPGVINHLGITPTIVFGEQNHSISERVLEIKALFDQSGINNNISESIDVELWKKFLFICSGGLLAITKSTYGELREVKETRQMFLEMFTEIYRLAEKAGIALPPDIPQKSLDFIDSLPYDSVASMARDIWAKKPSEIEYQNGAVVKLAEQYGIDVPINRFIYESILPMENIAREGNFEL